MRVLLGLILFSSVAFAVSAYPEVVTPEYLKDKYGTKPVKILIVPGHDDETLGGTVFRGFREADLNVKLGKELEKFFEADDNFEVFLARDESGYKSYLSYLFTNKRNDIEDFRKRVKAHSLSLTQMGLIQTKTDPIEHVNVSSDDAIKLYGINYWANQMAIDFVIHVHFNDYPGRLYAFPGKYSGFSIYVPEKQLPNARTSSQLAQSISDRLKKYFQPSDFPKESAGIIEDSSLIAIGANGSLYSPSILIEYGYIYEPQFINAKLRPLTMKELAYQTYLGVKKYFEPEKSLPETATFPYEWKKEIGLGLRGDVDVFALQLTLAGEGVYKCGPTGNFGLCTHGGVVNFQKKYGISPTGFVGPKTLTALNLLY